MANPLSRFHLSSRNRTVEIEYIDYVPKLNNTYDYTKIENIDVIINSWNNILLTPRGTYDHDPNYGSGLFDLIYEPIDNETAGLIKDEIISSVYYYDNRASINDINIKFMKGVSAKKGYNVKIDVEYRGEIKQMSLNFISTHGL